MPSIEVVGAIFEILGGSVALGISVLFGYLTWASGYVGVLIKASRKHHWVSPPIEECSALDLM